MKLTYTILAYACAALMGAAIGAWNIDFCPWDTAAMICIGMGCGLFVCLHELRAIRAAEERAAAEARRRARRAAFMREVDKLQGEPPKAERGWPGP